MHPIVWAYCPKESSTRNWGGPHQAHGLDFWVLFHEAFLHQPLTGLEPNDGTVGELGLKDEVCRGRGGFEDAFHGIRRLFFVCM